MSVQLVILDESPYLTLSDLSHTAELEMEWLLMLIEHGVLVPKKGSLPADWLFTVADMKRSQQAYRLQQDLHLDLESLDLVLDLVDQVQALRQHIEFLEKLHGK